MNARLLPLTLGLASAPAWAGVSVVGDAVAFPAFVVFALVIAVSLLATAIAARRVRKVSDFYIGEGVSSLQNGWAIAGEYLSAASLLGIAGLISLWGFDGVTYAVGWLVAFVCVLLLIAEPCRNIGRYTLGDILAYRNDPKLMRVFGALSVIVVSTFYLMAQMVAAGVLVKALIGIDYEVSMLVAGVLIVGYVAVGGMVATTWAQIVKAGLLVASSLVIVLIVWSEYGFFGGLVARVVRDPAIHAHVAHLLGHQADGMSAAELGRRFLQPGLLQSSALDQVSLGLALVLGTAGLPHILMRFFTVRTAREARGSVIVAMLVIGGFYLLALFLGFGAAVGAGPDAIRAIDPAGNFAVPLLAQALGGGPESLEGNLLLAMVAAVAFSTIVAVVAGLVHASSTAIAHDLYLGVIRRGHASPREQIRAARVATALVGAIAVIIGLLARGQNVAHLVALAFAVAASGNFPAVLMTLYWRRCNTAGVIAGLVVGTVSAVGLVLISPNMTYPLQERVTARHLLDMAEARRDVLVQQLVSDFPDVRASAQRDLLIVQREHDLATATLARFEASRTSLVGLEAPLIDLRNPGLISIPLGFIAVLLGSLLYRDERALAAWPEFEVRRETGLLTAKAVSA